MAHPLNPARPAGHPLEDHPLTYRMSPGVYKQYEAQLKHSPLVDDGTSVLAAGFKLGVEHALRILRAGFVVEER